MRLNRGISLGGYLSQCDHNVTHYGGFIGEKDIEVISTAGFDHVRLPVDAEVLEDEFGNGRYENFRYISNIVNWCYERDLNVIIDLHKAFGYDFNDAGNSKKNNLFNCETLQKRFIHLWEIIASRYADRTNVALELLNEVVETENAKGWNDLVDRTVLSIRKIAPEMPIIYGSIMWNSASTLALLSNPVSNNIIYTFHFYEPLLFTHQKAHWVKAMDPNKTIAYPDKMEFYKEESKKLNGQGDGVVNALSKEIGTELITEMVESAVQAAKIANVSLYCGEFGVIDKAPLEDTLRWFEDVLAVFRKYEIGCSVWNYKDKDFGIFDEHYEPIRNQLLECICN